MKDVQEIIATVMWETLQKVEANGGFRNFRPHEISKQSILTPAGDVITSTALERSRRQNTPADE